MTHQAFRLTVQTLTCALFLSGCPVWGPADDEQQFVSRCFDDFDCPVGTFCDGATGACVDSGWCITHGDCATGSYCDLATGLCLLSRPAHCQADNECGRGFECDFRNTCRPASDTCEGETDCEAEQLCIESQCRVVSETCQFDSQCAAGHVCVNNACTFPCPNDATCPDGTQCTGGLCLPSDAECIDSSECPDLTTNCVEGSCLRRCDEGCNAVTQECGDDGFCRTRWAPDPVDDAPFCSADTGCAGGAHVCVEGVCRTQCDTADPDPDAICASFDIQIPVCGGQGLCERESDCRTQSECGSGVDCIDGLCS